MVFSKQLELTNCSDYELFYHQSFSFADSMHRLVHYLFSQIFDSSLGEATVYIRLYNLSQDGI